VAQKFHFTILRIEVTRASRGPSATAKLLVKIANNNKATPGLLYKYTEALKSHKPATKFIEQSRRIKTS